MCLRAISSGCLSTPSSWKAPVLSSKACQITSRLLGKAYVAKGQTGGALDTMAVLQAYQADLLMDLGQGLSMSPDAVLELRPTATEAKSQRSFFAPILPFQAL